MTHPVKSISFVIQTECSYVIEPSSVDYDVDTIVDLLNKGVAICSFDPESNTNFEVDRDIFIYVDDKKQKIGTVLDFTLLDTEYHNFQVDED